jgi:hypothetical protein
MKRERALHGDKRLMLLRQLAACINVTLLTVRHLGTCRKKYSDMPLEDDHNLNKCREDVRPAQVGSRIETGNVTRVPAAHRITGSNLHFADCLMPPWKGTAMSAPDTSLYFF